MSNNISNDTIKFEFILKMINNLKDYRNRYNSISLMLSDSIAYDASLMCLLQIGETLNKIQGKYIELDDEDIRGAYSVRNFIAHDYDGVRLEIIEDILRYNIEKLEKSIIKILEDKR
jgi:uncharacterized protein with HEPN domain